MKMKKILVVCCTKSDGKSTPLYRSLAVPQFKDDVTLAINAENETGLPEVYNRYITSDNLIKHDIVLFVHDDVYIDDLKLKGKLYTAIETLNYDIVGLAGAKQLKIEKPCLWHLMSNQKDWSGAVSHPVNSGKQSITTSFGPWPARCLIIDGLFMAINLRKALEVEWKFNTDYTFHHYDLSSCIDANNKHMKIGTYPIYVTHSSPGLSNVNDSVFQESQNKFKNSYGPK